MRKLRSLSALALFSLGSSFCHASDRLNFVPDSLTIRIMSPIGTKFEDFSNRAQRSTNIASFFALGNVDFKPVNETAKEGKIIIPQTELNYNLSKKTTLSLRFSYAKLDSQGKESFSTPIPGLLRINVKSSLDAKVGIIGLALYHYPETDLKIKPYLSAGLECYLARVSIRNELNSRALYISSKDEQTLAGVTAFLGLGIETRVPYFLKALMNKDTKFQFGLEYHYPILGSDESEGIRFYSGFRMPLKL